MIAVAGIWAARPTPAADASWPPYFVGEVLVEATDDGATPGPGVVSVLTADDIRALGAATVAEAVAHLPGVFASAGARNEQRVWVRGYGPSDLLVLVDGVPIADPYSGEVDLGQVPLGNVARIVLARGGAAPSAGPGGLGGVLNIVTVQAGDGLGGGIEVRAAGERTVLANASAGGRAKAVDWIVGIGAEHSEGWPLSADFEATEWQGSGRRVNSDVEGRSLLGRIGVTFDSGSRLSATLRFIDAAKGIPFNTRQPQGFVRFARFPEWRQATAAAGFEGAVGETGGVRAQAYAHRFDNSLDVYNGPQLDEASLRSTFFDRVLGGYAVVDTVAGRHALRLAAHLRRDHHERFEAIPGGVGVRTERFTTWVGSVSGEDRFRLSSRTGLWLAGAVEQHAVTESWQMSSGDGVTRSSTGLSPQAELDVVLGTRLRGRWSLYRKTAFPTLRQLYVSDAPNPELEPQSATGTTVGLGWQPTEAVSVDANAYFDRVDNLITRAGRGLPYENQDRAEMAGLELSADGRWGRLEGRLAGALQRARLVDSVEGWDEVPYVPEGTLEAGLAVRIASASFLRLDWSWVGKRVWYDGSSRQVLEPYHLLRLAAGHRWRRVELRLDLANAADADIEQEWGYPLPGRRLWITVRVEF